MADKDLETLPEAASGLSGTELLYIVQDGNSRQIDLAELAAWIKTAETIIPANLPHRGARVYRTTDLTAVAWPTVLTWQAEQFDTDSFWNVGDPTRFTIPAGVSKVRLMASVEFELLITAGSIGLSIRKNATGTGGANAYGHANTYPRFASGAGFGTNLTNAFTGVVDVVPGDWFDCRLNVLMSGQDAIVGNNFQTWFEIEVVETN